MLTQFTSSQRMTMPDLVIENVATCDGKTYTVRKTVPAATVERTERTLAVAKTGSLAVRTSNTVGTLTMAASHGIITADRLDLYWDGGSRRGVVVGTVSVNSVPITGGSGDNLPAATTVITAQVPTLVEFLATGNNCQYLTSKLAQKGTLVLTEADGTEAYAHTDATTSNGGGKQWYTGNGATNPVVGKVITKAYLSNGSSSSTNPVVINCGLGT